MAKLEKCPLRHFVWGVMFKSPGHGNEWKITTQECANTRQEAREIQKWILSSVGPEDGVKTKIVKLQAKGY